MRTRHQDCHGGLNVESELITTILIVFIGLYHVSTCSDCWNRDNVLSL